jgi:repressor LexA
MVKPIRDPEYLSALQDYYARWRSLPSYSRLCDLLGLASRSAVGKVLTRLRDEGYLTRTPDEVWVPDDRFFERPHAKSTVPAGHPLIADDLSADTLALDQYLVANPSKTTLVTVQGDSMTGAGIHPGDVAIVERGRQSRDGDLVVAIVDGELTLKTLATEEGQRVLKPANPNYSTIRPRHSLELFGVVVGMVRKYGK